MSVTAIKQPKKQVAVKMCIKCGNILSIDSFMPNRNWEEQQGVDMYCVDCAKEMCVDKESTRKYFWENNRAWSESVWDAAEKRAIVDLANNAEWLKPSTSNARKESIRLSTIIRYVFTLMNTKRYYVFDDHASEDGLPREFNPNSMDGVIVENESGVFDEGSKTYNAVWNGFYTSREVEYLDAYYQKLEDGFVLDDINIQDYARKIAKASLEADSRYDLMRAGKCSSKEWREAQDIFDSLSKSAAFAACQKKEKTQNSDMIICEIIQHIEVNHHAEMPKVTFPLDDIDKILLDFSHTDTAIQ